jgi:hypothetical protein
MAGLLRAASTDAGETEIRVKGALHAHTTFSDGELTLEELRNVYMRRGYQFVCLADHAEYFDERAIALYRAEARRLSDASFCFVAGLEYECPERMHILGLGTTELLRTRDPQTVIQSIESDGGISIIAHPRTQDFSRIEALAVPPAGIEVWNSKYDGRYAPRTQCFELLQRIREREPRVRAYYGQDLHFRHQYTGLHVDLDAAVFDAASIVAALREGRYLATSGEVTLTADGNLDRSLAKRFGQLNSRSRRMGALARKSKSVLDSVGIRIPAGLKGQLRRLF